MQGSMTITCHNRFMLFHLSCMSFITFSLPLSLRILLYLYSSHPFVTKIKGKGILNWNIWGVSSCSQSESIFWMNFPFFLSRHNHRNNCRKRWKKRRKRRKDIWSICGGFYGRKIFSLETAKSFETWLHFKHFDLEL